jgi:alpha-galactosidase
MVLQPYEKQIVDLDDEEMLTTIGAVYVDTSHPEVPEFLAGRFQTMVDAYKPSFMKWDHHYGALAEGIRKDSTMTFLQGHNRTIRTIRAALPEDLIVTRSMGYLFGAMECYDAIRIGNDINHPGTISEEEPWAAIDFGKTNGTIRDEQEGKGLIRFARQASQNYYVHNNIAICDPDAFFVSPDYTVDEAKCHMTLQAIMGGLFFIGDRLETLPKERLEIANNQEMFKINAEGIHAVPLDLFSGIDIPRIWKSELEGRTIVTVFNWMDEESTTSFDLGNAFEMDEEQSYEVKELWSQEKVLLKKNKVALRQAPHSVMVLEFKNK